jgi:hypothetical protein
MATMKHEVNTEHTDAVVRKLLRCPEARCTHRGRGPTEFERQFSVRESVVVDG